MERVYKLKEPITFGSEEITELTVKKPKAKHLRGLSQNPNAGELLDLAAKLCGRSPKEIDELSIEDAGGLLEVVSDFLDSTPQTGDKP